MSKCLSDQKWFASLKGPSYGFWLYKNFEQVFVNEDLHIWDWNFNRIRNEECVSCALNFMTFGKYKPKLWPNMLFFFPTGQSGQIFKKNIFQKLKFEIDILDLCIRKKLWIIPFQWMNQKLWGVLVCGQLWILHSKTNFDVVYSTQFAIFFGKNKILGCRLFITTLQPLGLTFFNFIIKFFTN